MQKRFQTLMILVLCMVLLCAGGCAAASQQIAYSVYPIGYLLDRIAGNSITAVSIQTNTIVQKAQLKEDYREILSDSEVFMHIGDLEPYLSAYDDEIRTLGIQMLDLSAVNAIYPFGRLNGSSYYEEECFSHVDTWTYEMNLWMDPISMLSLADDIHDWLVKTYPENTALYDENYASLRLDLVNLDARFEALARELKESGQQLQFVTMSASFGIWQNTYGFGIYPVVLSKYGVLPDETQLSCIEQRIQNDGVRYIVYEPDMPDDMLALYERIQEDLDLTEITLSNLSMLSEEQMTSGKDYLSVMYENLSTLENLVHDAKSE